MRLGILLEKIKSALQESSCAYCSAEIVQEQMLCGVCSSKLGIRESYPLLNTDSFNLYAATLFNASIKKVIYSHKFYRRSRTGLMSSILIHYWNQLDEPLPAPEDILVVSIPPHERKPDHLHDMVRQFADHYGYRCDTRALDWQRPVEPQHHLSGKRRRFENVSQGMNARLPLAPGKVPKLIVVVDDITTTGATMLEAARAIRHESAGTVPVLGLALCSVSLALQKHLL